MNFNFTIDIASLPAGTGAAERRAQAQREEEARAAARRESLAAQTSPDTAPQERIRIWERLHALQLPRAASHKLVRVIAAQTDLSVRQVQEEQQRRAATLGAKAQQP